MRFEPWAYVSGYMPIAGSVVPCPEILMVTMLNDGMGSSSIVRLFHPECVGV